MPFRFRAMPILAILCCATVSLAHAAEEHRVALVVGNAGYGEHSALTNTISDAEQIARTLRESKFTNVIVATNLSREKFVDALRSFAYEAERSDWAVIYYAGHGIEYNGINYLIPVDARLKADRDLQFEALPLTQVLAAVEGAKKLRLLILDACRNNPFTARMRRSTATRSIGSGLARIEPDGGVLVAYAAKDGQVAYDGVGEHSPFASALVKHLATPGLEINRLFRRVRSDVLTSTNGRQEPFVYGSLPDEDFYFRASSAVPAVATPPVREEPLDSTSSSPPAPPEAVEPPQSPLPATKQGETAASLSAPEPLSVPKAPEPSILLSRNRLHVHRTSAGQLGSRPKLMHSAASKSPAKSRPTANLKHVAQHSDPSLPRSVGAWKRRTTSPARMGKYSSHCFSLGGERVCE